MIHPTEVRLAIAVALLIGFIGGGLLAEALFRAMH